MAEAKKKEKKKVEVKTTKFKITKSNGGVIYRDKSRMGANKVKRYKNKGYKVEEVK